MCFQFQVTNLNRLAVMSDNSDLPDRTSYRNIYEFE